MGKKGRGLRGKQCTFTIYLPGQVHTDGSYVGTRPLKQNEGGPAAVEAILAPHTGREEKKRQRKGQEQGRTHADMAALSQSSQIHFGTGS